MVLLSQGEEVPRLWFHLQAPDTDEQVFSCKPITHKIQVILTKYFKAQEFVRQERVFTGQKSLSRIQVETESNVTEQYVD